MPVKPLIRITFIAYLLLKMPTWPFFLGGFSWLLVFAGLVICANLENKFIHKYATLQLIQGCHFNNRVKTASWKPPMLLMTLFSFLKSTSGKAAGNLHAGASRSLWAQHQLVVEVPTPGQKLRAHLRHFLAPGKSGRAVKGSAWVPSRPISVPTNTTAVQKSSIWKNSPSKVTFEEEV